MNRLYEALEKANQDEALGLCAILQCSGELAARRAILQERLEIFLARHFASALEPGTYPYSRLCDRVAVALNMSVTGSDTDIELHIVEHFAEAFDATVRSSGANAFNEILATYDGKHKTQLLQTFAAGGFIALFRAGGFDAYAAGSIVLHSLSAALGVTLPFGAYMALSSAFSVAIGPLAWLALGASALGAIKKRNDMRFVPLIIWTYLVLLEEPHVEADNVVVNQLRDALVQDT